MHYCKLYIQLVVRFKCLYVTVDPLSPSHLITVIGNTNIWLVDIPTNYSNITLYNK